MRRTSVVIADRHPVVLQGLMKVLETQPDFTVVACCSDGMSCIEAMRNLMPDIAILEISIPELTGLEILDIANSENLATRGAVRNAVGIRCGASSGNMKVSFQAARSIG